MSGEMRGVMLKGKGRFERSVHIEIGAVQVMISGSGDLTMLLSNRKLRVLAVDDEIIVDNTPVPVEPVRDENGEIVKPESTGKRGRPRKA